MTAAAWFFAALALIALSGWLIALLGWFVSHRRLLRALDVGEQALVDARRLREMVERWMPFAPVDPPNDSDTKLRLAE